jgi:hypothetical protein
LYNDAWNDLKRGESMGYGRSWPRLLGTAAIVSLTLVSPCFLPSAQAAGEGNTIAGDAKAVGHEAKELGIKIGTAAKEGGVAVGHAAKKGGIAVGKAVKNGGVAAGEAFREVGREIRDEFRGDGKH